MRSTEHCRSCKAIVADHHSAYTPAPAFQQPTKIDWPSVEGLAVYARHRSAIQQAAEAAFHAQPARPGATLSTNQAQISSG